MRVSDVTLSSVDFNHIMYEMFHPQKELYLDNVSLCKAPPGGHSHLIPVQLLHSYRQQSDVIGGAHVKKGTKLSELSLSPGSTCTLFQRLIQLVGYYISGGNVRQHLS